MHNRKKTFLILSVCVLILFITAFAGAGSGAHGRYAGNTIVHVDSYHKGYEWSDGIISGVNSVLKGSGGHDHTLSSVFNEIISQF